MFKGYFIQKYKKDSFYLGNTVYEDNVFPDLIQIDLFIDFLTAKGHPSLKVSIPFTDSEHVKIAALVALGLGARRIF